MTPEQTGFRVSNVGSGTVHMFVDVIGYYVADDSGRPALQAAGQRDAPVRILDTRTDTGLSGPFGAEQTRTAHATCVAIVDSVFVVGNTTGVKPTVPHLPHGVER